MTHDVIVVGAGAAGCVVAARLTEDPRRRVLLLEAGPDYTGGEWPPDLLDGRGFPRSHLWGLVGEPLAEGGAGLPLPRGKVVGGSTAVNFCVALRGRPADHDAWAAPGLPRWSWREVLPFYRALEHDPGGDPRWHGTGGPTPVHRADRADLTGSQVSFLDACGKAGMAMVDDHNAPDSVGAGMTPLNVVDGVRQNAAPAYLGGALDRPNLTIMADAEVHSVVLRDGAAVGVRLGSGEIIEAGQVVLSAGAYGSPTILLRSGIGPAGHLREVGVDVAVDLPGVGSNLMEHPATAAVFAAEPEVAERPVSPLRTMATLRSSPDQPDIDLHIHALAIRPTQARGPHPTGHDFMMTACLVSPRSRGSVRLRSADIADPPLIDTGMLADPDDVRRLAEGLRVVHGLAAEEPLAGRLRGDPGPGGQVPDAATMASRVGTYNHPAGTCRMGPAEDPDAVVDEACQVRRVPGLLVIDAAVMPVSPRATTMLPVLMLAERAVALNWPGGADT